MQTSEQVNEIFTAMAKAQGNRFEESKVIPRMANQIIPLPGRNQNSNIDVTWRFFEKISYGMSDCWYWRGSIDQLGYGRTRNLGENRAHRFAWRLFRGDIPEGMHVLHKCDVRNCVNPDHLFLGTHLDNMRDCAAKKRNIGPRRIHFGGESPNSKLSESAVKQIRIDAASGNTQKSLAALYGVGEMTISRIVRRQLWKHVKD